MLLVCKLIQNNETYSGQFHSLVDDEKNWVLDYLCGGKGVIPYEKVKKVSRGLRCSS